MKHSGGAREFLRHNTFPLVVAGAWLLVVWAFVLLADVFFKKPLGLDAWAGDWDAGWYRSIVEGGYSQGPINQQINVAFFPLLPSLTWLVSKVTLLPTVWSGMLVASVSFASALVVLWHFVGKFFTPQVAKWTLLLVAFNPFSLYFGMFYTESLFLLLAVSAFWFIYEKHWWLAAFFAGLATATRSVGVAVAAAVLVGWVYERFRREPAQPLKPGWRTAPLVRSNVSEARQTAQGVRTLRSAQKSASLKVGKRQRARTPWAVWLPQTFMLALIACSGLIIFSLYIWQHTGDPMAYRSAQEFWPGRGGLTNLGNEVLYVLQSKVINLEYALTVMWYACTVLALVGLAMVVYMRRWLLALYTAIALALPLVFGTATSMNRYMLVAFPIFIAYAALLQKVPAWLRVVLLALGIAGLGVITFLMVDPRHPFIS